MRRVRADSGPPVKGGVIVTDGLAPPACSAKFLFCARSAWPAPSRETICACDLLFRRSCDGYEATTEPAVRRQRPLHTLPDRKEKTMEQTTRIGVVGLGHM